MEATTSRFSDDEFTLAEMIEMENKFKERGEGTLDTEFCQELATKFSCSLSRITKPEISWEQVQNWFMDKHIQKEGKAETKRDKTEAELLALKWHADLSHTGLSSNLAGSSRRPNGSKATDLSELAFEARSVKDYAWYDVASFQTYRVLHNGELEVRVRFSGFNNAEDEWVNVREDVRERSIPLEPSECHKVKIGDLMLCFQERETHAVYCDAHVAEIHRHLHDATRCTCIFVVRYDHDYSEENVQLERLCCRPA